MNLRERDVAGIRLVSRLGESVKYADTQAVLPELKVHERLKTGIPFQFDDNLLW